MATSGHKDTKTKSDDRDRRRRGRSPERRKEKTKESSKKDKKTKDRRRDDDVKDRRRRSRSRSGKPVLVAAKAAKSSKEDTRRDRGSKDDDNNKDTKCVPLSVSESSESEEQDDDEIVDDSEGQEVPAPPRVHRHRLRRVHRQSRLCQPLLSRPQGSTWTWIVVTTRRAVPKVLTSPCAPRDHGRRSKTAGEARPAAAKAVTTQKSTASTTALCVGDPWVVELLGPTSTAGVPFT